MNPIELLEEVLSLTPTTQSVEPGVLASFHSWARQALSPGDLSVSPAEVLTETPSRPLVLSLVLMEVLAAVGDLDTAIALGEQLYTDHPMDHRVQDSLCRMKYYQQVGKVFEEPGRELRGSYCSMLWNTIHVLPNGNVHLCCSVWMRTPIGNVFQEAPQQIWRSERAEAIRNSVRDGDYRFCGKLSCPHIQRRLFKSQEGSSQDPIWLSDVPVTPAIATRFNLSYDRTCNLSCPSCRTELIAAKGPELERIEAVTDRLLPLLKGGQRLEVTGSGDPFASKSFRRLLASVNREEFPELKITIMTNGQLMRRSEWGKFAHLHGMIDAVNVSVDAARAETYAMVRRGGELAELLPNLDFIGELRRDGAIRQYRVCFVVQDHNFREMTEFLELGQKVGADTLHFQMLHDWGTYQPAELNKRRIHRAEHPEHGAFLEVLRSLPKSSTPKILSDFAYLT